ncbi:MAG TPA: MBL fold metallo-hydrolase RNA specificity domain-containing protein [Armatimonadota bacterium]|nr:MBL fold metallo-hydrolase RNA specificity domain-containing protein [Armatimonadota bacterium]
MARLTCYDGVGCIGGNKILLEDGGTKLWLDFGTNYSQWGKFYEEYLKPKTCAGLYEPIQMGLLPPIRDLYREDDLVYPDADPWHGIEAQSIGDVRGILLSHAHLDHMGMLPYVHKEIPVYCSGMTFAVATVTQETGTGASVQYCRVKSPKLTETGLTLSGASGPIEPRPFVFVAGCPGGAFSEFRSDEPARGKLGPAAGERPLKCGDLKVRAFPVDHSIYGACAWAIETSAGCVVYTGDLRCHGRQAELTWRFAEEAGKLKPRVLIIEGTRIDKEDTRSEEQVRQRALDEVKKAKGLVVADFGPRNIERLALFLDIAKETGRTLLLTPKDAYLLKYMALAAGNGDVPSLNDQSIAIYSEYEASTSAWKKGINEKYPEKLIRPENVAKHQDKFICCFSFFDVNELAYIKPVAGSIWIYSSCEAFNEDMRIDLVRLGEWLRHHEMVFMGGDDEDEKNPFHASGHACRSDLLKLVDIIRPEVVIPVHTEKPELFKEALAGRCGVLLPERGVPIDL